jgi:hypothetical protein
MHYILFISDCINLAHGSFALVKAFVEDFHVRNIHIYDLIYTTFLDG